MVDSATVNIIVIARMIVNVIVTVVVTVTTIVVTFTVWDSFYFILNCQKSLEYYYFEVQELLL